MGFWDLVHYSWFGFLGLAVFAVLGAAIYDSTASKNRRKRAARPAIAETELQEEPMAEEQPSEFSELENAAPVSEVGFEELDEQDLT